MRAGQLSFLCRLWRLSRQSAGASAPAPASVRWAPGPVGIDTSGGPVSGPPALARAQVLLIGNDRRFRAVASTLLSRRGHAVTVGGQDDDVVGLAVRVRADVVVIDAGASLTAAARTAARLDALRPRVTVLTVGEESGEGLAALPVLSKWSCFDEVMAAIDGCMTPVANGAGDVLL